MIVMVGFRVLVVLVVRAGHDCCLGVCTVARQWYWQSHSHFHAGHHMLVAENGVNDGHVPDADHDAAAYDGVASCLVSPVAVAS